MDLNWIFLPSSIGNFMSCIPALVENEVGAWVGHDFQYPHFSSLTFLYISPLLYNHAMIGNWPQNNEHRMPPQKTAVLLVSIDLMASPHLSLWLASSSTTTQSKAGLPSTSHSGQSGHSLTSCSSLSEGNCGNHGNLTILINDSLTMWRQQWCCPQDKVMQSEVCQRAGSWAYLKIKWGNLKIKWGRPHKQGMEQVVPLQGVPTSQLWPSVHVTVQLSTAPNTT